MANQSTASTIGSIPKFESTLVIAFPDVLLAGPKILLSAADAHTNGTSIPTWSHYCSRSSKNSNAGSNSRSNFAATNKIQHSTAAVDANQQRMSLLTIVVAPPTMEQASYLCEAIVNQAQTSGTEKIILVAASNFATKEQRTHVVQIHHDGAVEFPAVPRDVALGDHILNTFLTLLTFAGVPTTALVHPAKKGTGLKESQTVLENLTTSLALVIGDKNSAVFSAERAIQYSVLRSEDDGSVESMMYL
ncbi:hypothetical protein BC939DRAFT_29581 [Gamsiella multidivaricata]|uniref:uncharacterized protein n=1 Tax=Gamsiella multidivaricata TaxID=101098 RepID=UPI002220DA0E